MAKTKAPRAAPAKMKPSTIPLDPEQRARLVRCLRYVSSLDMKAVAACITRAKILDTAKSEPRLQYLHAFKQKGKDRAAASIKALEKMKRDDIADAHMLDIFLGDYLKRAGRCGEAVPLFAGALKANPYLAALYKDIGDCYFAKDPTLAWFFYDLGRSLPGGPAAPGIAAVADYEAQFAARHPDWF